MHRVAMVERLRPQPLAIGADRHRSVDHLVTPVAVDVGNAQLVIAAIGAVARELFVPETRRSVAYVDEDLSIGKPDTLVSDCLIAKLQIEEGTRQQVVHPIEVVRAAYGDHIREKR